MIQSFDKRLRPFRIGSIPEPCFFYGVGAIIFIGFTVMASFPFNMFSGVISAAIAYFVYDEWVNYDNKPVSGLIQAGRRNDNMKSFLANGYFSKFTYETHIGENGIMHNDGAVSIMFSWRGVHNRYYSDAETAAEHIRRVGLLRNLATHPNITIEHHMFRVPDAGLVDEYNKEFKKMHSDMPPPPIIEDIHNQVCDTYRPLAKSNKTITCITLTPKKKRGLLSLFKPDTLKNYSQAKKLYEQLLGVFRGLENDYNEASLLSYDQFAKQIQVVQGLSAARKSINYKFNLAEQLVIVKPVVDESFIKINDTYCKTGVLQNYPSSLSLDWINVYCEANIDLHVCQLIRPINDDKMLDKSVKDEQFMSAMMSDTSGVDKTVSNMRAAKDFRSYVAERNIPVCDNAYIITVYSKDKLKVEKFFSDLEKEITRTDGLLRSDPDIQQELACVRIPGMGVRSPYLRNDHADTIAAMMPFTTFPTGERNPEILRITTSGQLVGLKPSKLEVAHEMIVAETGGGKDTQFGWCIGETYKRIRYDIVELGNSYQGIIEAIGGAYCRAKEQVINPLASYSEYDNAKNTKDIKGNTLEKMLLISQTNLIAPIFKGFTEGGAIYTNKEEAVVGCAVRHCYDNPDKEVAAPTLLSLKGSLEKVDLDSTLEDTRHYLLEELHTFLLTETGSCFKEQDQYIINPVANAIDFSGVEGKLFDYFLSFMCIRLANNAMARGARSQIVLNEYRVLLERAKNPVKHITLTIDRMGRKDSVGLTRITQGSKEIQSVDAEAVNSMPNKTLLSRRDQHSEIGNLLGMPHKLQSEWQAFKTPEEMNKLSYREAMIACGGNWHHLYLKFPQLLLDLMNTRGEDKGLREIAYKNTSDPYERIKILKELQSKRVAEESGALI